MEIAVKAAETGRLNKDPEITTLFNTAQELVTPLTEGPRKQRFQARLDLLNTETALDTLIALLRINRSFSTDNYFGIAYYYLPKAIDSINGLTDASLKSRLQDRVAVINTIPRIA